MKQVVTYQSHSGNLHERVSICRVCAARLLRERSWPRDGHGEEMVTVYHGGHAGQCDACDGERGGEQ